MANWATTVLITDGPFTFTYTYDWPFQPLPSDISNGPPLATPLDSYSVEGTLSASDFTSSPNSSSSRQASSTEPPRPAKASPPTPSPTTVITTVLQHITSVTSTETRSDIVTASPSSSSSSPPSSSLSSSSSSSSSPAPSLRDDNARQHLSASISRGAVAGICVGALAGLLVLGFLMYALYRRTRQRGDDDENIAHAWETPLLTPVPSACNVKVRKLLDPGRDLSQSHDVRAPLTMPRIACQQASSVPMVDSVDASASPISSCISPVSAIRFDPNRFVREVDAGSVHFSEQRYWDTVEEVMPEPLPPAYEDLPPSPLRTVPRASERLASTEGLFEADR